MSQRRKRVPARSRSLASFLTEYIDTLPKGTPWLFPSVGALQGHTLDGRKAFVRAVTAAGLERFRPDWNRRGLYHCELTTGRRPTRPG